MSLSAPGLLGGASSACGHSRQGFLGALSFACSGIDSYCLAGLYPEQLRGAAAKLAADLPAASECFSWRAAAIFGGWFVFQAALERLLPAEARAAAAAARKRVLAQQLPLT